MPKPKYIVSDFEKDLLIHELFLKTGITIKTKRDCRRIAELISQNESYISESTLYRIFVYVTDKYTPYMHTLNILSEFCNYSGWDDFILKNESPKTLIGRIGGHGVKNNVKSFSTCSIMNNEYKILKNYFLQFSDETSIKHCHIIGNDIFKALLEHSESCKNFYAELSDVPIIRKSFFELLADPDFELWHYEYGLQQYLKNTREDGSVKEIQDKMFALALLSRNCFINGDRLCFVKNIKLLKKMETEVRKELKHIATFPKARFLTYLILYYKELKSSNDQMDYENWLITYLYSQRDTLNFQDSKIWIHTIIDMYLNVLQRERFYKLIEAFLEDFKELYPTKIWNKQGGLDFLILSKCTNQNASAHWKEIWRR